MNDWGWESGQPLLGWRVDASGWGSRATAFILPWHLPLEASGPGPSGGGEGVVYSAGGAGVRWASLGPAWPACASRGAGAGVRGSGGVQSGLTSPLCSLTGGTDLPPFTASGDGLLCASVTMPRYPREGGRKPQP